MHQCMEMWTRQGHDERITRHRLVCSINAESLSFANLKKHNNLQDGMAAKIFLGEASRTSKPESWTRRSQRCSWGESSPTGMANLSRMMLLKRQRMMADSEHVKDNGRCSSSCVWGIDLLARNRRLIIVFLIFVMERIGWSSYDIGNGPLADFNNTVVTERVFASS
ncbi:hypothetical protein BDR07DRAFT_1459349 [Suillus spraguei]|nr:hypothetical protein BDR07DRAFT_1459349 [Suillus spraguei]